MALLGFQCKLYRNTGTYGTPTWDEMPLVRDLQLNQPHDEADMSNRGSSYKQFLAGQTDVSVEFSHVWEPGDADFEALRDAYLNRTPIDLAVMDGDIGSSGTQGLRAEFTILNFSRTENLSEGVVAEITAKPAFSTNSPAWMIVA